MNSKICLFEDAGFKNLLPLVYLRPVYDLRCGILTIREKIEKHFPSHDIILHSRNVLVNSLRENKFNLLPDKIEDDSIIFVNGRLLPDSEFVEIINSAGNNTIFISGDELAAAKLTGTNLKSFLKQNPELINTCDLPDCSKIEVKTKLLKYSWNYIYNNADEIKKDFDLLVTASSEINEFPGVHFLNKGNIYLGKGVELLPNVVIDASKGPIYIGDNVKIMPNACIQGPVYIGNNSTIKPNSYIYEGTSIGPVCKAGGEIENSIMHSYSNKQHDGFLGHSYLGSWVNIGAGSNTSDLKMNYGSVKVKLNGEDIDTGLTFLGLIMGDHSKCGIDTMFNTGTITGISSSLFGCGFLPKYIPSFIWGGTDGYKEGEIRKAMETAKIVKSRRNVSMSVAKLELLKAAFEATKKERTDFIK